MTIKSLLMQCVLRRMQKITAISQIRIFRRSIFLMSGSQKIRSELPEFREEKAARYQSEFGLPEYDSQILTESRHLAALFEDVATLSGNPKKAANWFMVEVLRLVKEKGIEAEKLRFTPQHLADLLTMVDKKEVSPQNAKKVFEKVFDEDIDPVAYVEEHGLKIVEDTGLLSSTISRILDENPGPLSEFLGGKEKVMGFFVGQIMKEMKGKANPASVRERRCWLRLRRESRFTGG